MDASASLFAKVFKFLFVPAGLTVPFLIVMLAVFAAGAVHAAVHYFRLGGRIDELSSRYRNEPSLARLEPMAFLRLGLDEESAERLVTTVPGILITTGILGTFLGLGVAVGEAGAALSSPEEAIVGLQGLLRTVSFKFQASAWGILLSIVYVPLVSLPFHYVVERKLESSSLEMMDAHRTIGDELRDAVQAALAPTTEGLVGSVSGLQSTIRILQSSITKNLSELTNATGQIKQTAEKLGNLGGDIDRSLRSMEEQRSRAAREQQKRLDEALSRMGRAMEDAAGKQIAASEGLSTSFAASTSMLEQQLAEKLDRIRDELKHAGDEQTRRAGAMTAQLAQAMKDIETSTAHMGREVPAALRDVKKYQAKLVGVLAQLDDGQRRFADKLDRVTELAAELSGRSASERLEDLDRRRRSTRGAAGRPAEKAGHIPPPPPSVPGSLASGDTKDADFL